MKKKTGKIVRDKEEEPDKHIIFKKMVHNLQEEVSKKNRISGREEWGNKRMKTGERKLKWEKKIMRLLEEEFSFSKERQQNFILKKGSQASRQGMT